MRRKRAPVPLLNITSLVDVALTLLVIFMIASPLIQYQIEISLPETNARELTEEEALVISITKEGRVYLGSKLIKPEDLTDRLKEIKKEKRLRTVSIRGDSKTNYGLVMEVMGFVREAGIEDVGLVVIPKREQ